MDDDAGVKTPSMGCLVEEGPCSICRDGGVPTGKPLRYRPRDLDFFSVSIVKAPRCEGCQERMEPVSSTEWACKNESCPEQGKSVHTGVYPFFQRSGDLEQEERE